MLQIEGFMIKLRSCQQTDLTFCFKLLECAMPAPSVENESMGPSTPLGKALKVADQGLQHANCSCPILMNCQPNYVRAHAFVGKQHGLKSRSMRWNQQKPWQNKAGLHLRLDKQQACSDRQCTCLSSMSKPFHLSSHLSAVWDMPNVNPSQLRGMPIFIITKLPITPQHCQKRKAGCGVIGLPESCLPVVAWEGASACLASALVVVSASASASVSAWAVAFATSSPTQSRPPASASGKIQGPFSSLWPTAGGCGSKGLLQALTAPPWLKLRGWQLNLTIKTTACPNKFMPEHIIHAPEHIQTRRSNHTHVAQKSSKQAVSTSTAKAHLVGALSWNQ